MKYITTLYSQSLDRFEIDCNTEVYYVGDLTTWVEKLPNYYNKKNQVDDFEIISIIKIGE